ncbi:MAG: DUF1800 domain-containing protein [Burkholderiales bacterium]|nr:DUF1800 domain-containing protein [Burkholderiales bacterium]
MLTLDQAARFLGQATFGPKFSEIGSLSGTTVSSWLNAQFNVGTASHKEYMDTVIANSPPGTKFSHNNTFETFWTQAVTGPDQLRQRVKFALSQIFVVSLIDSGVGNKPRGMASYYDTLGAHAFGNFRNLLEAVTLHPMMGVYLAMLRNQKESGNRVPDQNYAREIMQLFTIGLYMLNLDGSPKLSGGNPIETYTPADIVGLSRVFTGWSWYGPDKTDFRFRGGNLDADADWRPMQSYPQFHSTLEKMFLGVRIPASNTPDPEGDLRIALDTLFNHPNVGPFIGKQLIQHLVTSNPSALYVGRVAQVFNDNGQGVRGDLKAVVKAILTDTEARQAPDILAPNVGKLREPILRMTNWMRAFNCSSASGRFMIANIDDPLIGIGQNPFRSPSVFNYFRPGYVPPNSSIAGSGLVAPEMQLTAETSVTGYLNTMRDVIVNGIGSTNINGNPKRDVQPSYTVELTLADLPAELVDRVSLLLTGRKITTTLRDQIITAISAIYVSNDPVQAPIGRQNRVSATIFLMMASPEYLVQK